MHTKLGFVVERITEWKEYVYTFKIFGIGILGNHIEKKDYLPIGYGNNGVLPFVSLKGITIPPFKNLESAVKYIKSIVARFNEENKHVDKIYYPPFDEN